MRGDTVEVVIRIPKREIEEIKRYCRRVELKISSLEDYIYRSIANGIVLPKGHGRLIDADEVSKGKFHFECQCDCAVCSHSRNCECDLINSIPTIIEADKDGDINGKTNSDS